MAGRYAYPRTSRLLRGWQYDLVFRTGRRAQGELVRLLFVEAPDGLTRVGAAVGKRQGKAHVRSRGRRIIREGVRRLLPWMADSRIWFVVLLRRRGLTARADAIYFDLERLLRERGFLAPDFPGAVWNAGEE